MTGTVGGTDASQSLPDGEGAPSSHHFLSHDARSNPIHQDRQRSPANPSWVLPPYHASFQSTSAHALESRRQSIPYLPSDSDRGQMRSPYSQPAGLETVPPTSRPGVDGPYYAWQSGTATSQSEADRILLHPPPSSRFPDTGKLKDSTGAPYYSWGSSGRTSFDSSTSNRSDYSAASTYNSFNSLNSPVEPEGYRARIHSIPSDFQSSHPQPYSEGLSLGLTRPLGNKAPAPYTSYNQSQHLYGGGASLHSDYGAYPTSTDEDSTRRGSAGSATSDTAPLEGATSTLPAANSEERPYQCDGCHLAFHRNHDLKRHKRIHLEVKPFPCPLSSCDKRFTRKDALKRHLLVKQHDLPRSMRANPDEADDLGEDDSSASVEKASGKAKRTRVGTTPSESTGPQTFTLPPALDLRDSPEEAVSPTEEEPQRPSIHPLVVYSARSGSNQFGASSSSYSPTSTSSNGTQSFSTNATSTESVPPVSSSYRPTPPPFDRRYSGSPSYEARNLPTPSFYETSAFQLPNPQPSYPYPQPNRSPFTSTQSLPILPTPSDGPEQRTSPHTQRPPLPGNLSSYP